MMKLGKHSESKAILDDIKAGAQKDHNTIKYLVFIYTAFGQNEDATKLLEGV